MSAGGMIEAFAAAVAEAVALKDGDRLASLLYLPEDLNEQQRYRELLPEIELHPDNPLPSWLWQPLCPSWNADEAELWGEVVRQLLQCLRLYRRFRMGNSSVQMVFTVWLGLCQAYLRPLSTGERWQLQALYGLCEGLWDLARQASLEEGSDGPCEEAARLVNRAFTACITDRNPNLEKSRKWGAYRIAGLLFRIYFHLGQLSLCNNALRAMGAAMLPDLEAFPAGARVTFRYYLGRWHFVNERYTEALAELQAAFIECHPEAHKAKRQCLHLLLPLRILLDGAMPRKKLLERHGLATGFYAEAMHALKIGNLTVYRSLLSEYERGLLNLGTLPLWERLERVAARALVRRTHRLLDSPSRLPFTALLSVSPDRDSEETACVLAGLIACGLMRGYLSQGHATLVLSQKEPFPCITACRL